MTNPTFGEKIDNVDYRSRFGVYAIIPNPTHDKIILVQAPKVLGFFQVGKLKKMKIT